jgi:outer membrane protein assembly factor BamB
MSTSKEMTKVLLLLVAVSCSAAEWTCAGREQKNEKILSINNVSKLQLVIKLKLGDAPLGPPVMLGGLVTAKGIKDLVILAAGGSVYAVDSDLGTLLWERHLEEPRAVVPVLQPSSGDAEEDHLFFGVRPLFLMQAGRRTVALNAGNGVDMDTPKQIPSCTTYKSDAAVANGVRFVLANGATKPVLQALDAKDGRELFNSGDQIAAPVGSSGLAIANGHVCFGDTKGTLYCYGFPIDF